MLNQGTNSTAKSLYRDVTFARGACGLPAFHRGIKFIVAGTSRKPAGVTPGWLT